MTFEELIIRQKGLMARREALLIRTLASDYVTVQRQIDAELTRILTSQQPNAWKIARLKALSRQVEESVTRITVGADARLADEIRVSVLTGVEHATAQAEFFNVVRVNTRGVRELVTRAVEKKGYFSLLPKETANKVREELVKGLALGKNPNVTAREVQKIIGGSFNRAATISRTETLGAYRRAQIQTYANNSEVFSGWIWIAARTTRTCAICWSMHGTIHSFDEPFASHSRCRCSASPYIKVAQNRPVIRKGTTLFRELPVADKKKILGPSKYGLYAKGKISLPDLVAVENNPIHGLIRREKTLSEIT